MKVLPVSVNNTTVHGLQPAVRKTIITGLITAALAGSGALVSKCNNTDYNFEFSAKKELYSSKKSSDCFLENIRNGINTSYKFIEDKINDIIFYASHMSSEQWIAAGGIGLIGLIALKEIYSVFNFNIESMLDDPLIEGLMDEYMTEDLKKHSTSELKWLKKMLEKDRDKTLLTYYGKYKQNDELNKKLANKLRIKIDELLKLKTKKK